MKKLKFNLLYLLLTFNICLFMNKIKIVECIGVST